MLLVPDRRKFVTSLTPLADGHVADEARGTESMLKEIQDQLHVRTCCSSSSRIVH
jgi:hypothetical protein